MHATHTSTLSWPLRSVVGTVAVFLLAAIAGCASEADAPGSASGDSNDGYEVWIVDQANVAEVFEAGTGGHINTVELAGPVSDDPSPDLVDVSPAGNLLFVSLRGSVPLTGDPHNSTGTTPGLGIIRVDADGRDGALIAVAPLSNVRDGENIADPHAVRVRTPR